MGWPRQETQSSVHKWHYILKEQPHISHKLPNQTQKTTLLKDNLFLIFGSLLSYKTKAFTKYATVQVVHLSQKINK